MKDLIIRWLVSGIYDRATAMGWDKRPIWMDCIRVRLAIMLAKGE